MTRFVVDSGAALRLAEEETEVAAEHELFAPTLLRSPAQDPDEPPYIWALHAGAIAATNAAWRGKPSSIIWHFQLERDR